MLKSVLFALALTLLALPAVAQTSDDWQRYENGKISCFARGEDGQEYEGRWFNQRDAEERAWMNCMEAGNRSCEIIGCQRPNVP